MQREDSHGSRRRGYLWLGVTLLVLAGIVTWMGFAAIRPGNAPETMQAIQAAAAAQRWEEVEARLLRWIDAHPGDDQACVMLGLLMVEQERPEEAIAILQRVSESAPARSQAQAIIGELHLQAWQAPAAERALREAAERDPLNLEPRQRLVYLLSLEQRNREARQVLREMVEATRNARILIDLVLESWAVEVDTRAMGSEIDAFFGQSPLDPYVRRVKGLSLLVQGRAEEALPLLQEAARSLDQDPLGRFALAECLLALGRFQEDESILGACPEDPAEAARWWIFRSRLQEVLGKPEEGLASLAEAVKVHPENIEAHYRIGQALIRDGRTEEGVKHLEQAETLKTAQDRVRTEFENLRRQGFAESADLYERLGGLCREVGLRAEARAWYEFALSLDPARASIRSALADPAPVPSAHTTLATRPIAARKADLEGRETPETDATMRRSSSSVKFEEVTERVGIAYQYDSGATGNMYLGDTMGGGVGLLDFDRDGWLDIYFVNGGSVPDGEESARGRNVLYRNRGDGTFEDVTEQAGVAGRGYGMGCAVGDLDNDGFDDLFVTGLGRTVLYRNRGDGTFEDITEQAGVGSDRWTTAAGFGDLDGDGDLDLVVVAYVEADPNEVAPCRDHTGRAIHCSPRRFVAQADLLFRNEGDGTFTNVSERAGFDDAPEGRGLGLAIADLDGDGRLDLFVANDLSHDFLFLNQGEFRFEEVGMSAGVACNGSARVTSSMGVIADDLDGDGLLDLFVTNFQNEPNTLFRGLGRGQFVDETLVANLLAPSLPVTGFGTAALDVDNDGRLDLFVANGHVDDQPWINSPMAQKPHLFLAHGAGRFMLSDEAASPYLAQRVVGRGLAAGDLDNDGRIDLVIVHRDAPAVVLRNESASGRWLGLSLRGDRSGSTPIGTRVTLRAEGRNQTRWLTSGTSYLSAHDPRLWFGLGSAERVESLKVRWPSGLEQSWTDLPVDQILELREGDETPHPVPGSPKQVISLESPLDGRPSSPRDRVVLEMGVDPSLLRSFELLLVGHSEVGVVSFDGNVG